MPKTRRTISRMTLCAVWFTIFFLSVQRTGAQEDFKAWLERENGRFQQFKDERDRQFSEFLKKNWLEIDMLKAPERDALPKPVRIPVYIPPVLEDTMPLPVTPSPQPTVPEINPPPSLPTPSPLQKTPSLPLHREEPPPPIIEEPDKENLLRIMFFGQPLNLEVPDDRTPALSGVPSKDAISEFWEAWASASYDAYLDALQRHANHMELNDWGYLQLLHRLGETLYPQSGNASRLFVWFMLNKSGYLARVGYHHDRVYLLAPTATVLYGHSYFTFEGHRHKFYALMFEEGDKPAGQSVYTYDSDYPGADRVLSLDVPRLPDFGTGSHTDTRSFTYRGKAYRIPVTIDRNIVDFLATYPQTGYEVYFTASISTGAKTTMLPALQAAIEGLPEAEAANLLLRFMQTAFEYQTDEEQFRREKTMFPDETLFYPSSDCEDRAILFAYLVRNLLGLEVVGLDYPGHIATGVRFTGPVDGDVVRYENASYVICDPTYINADIGKPIPQVQDFTPDVIGIGK